MKRLKVMGFVLMLLSGILLWRWQTYHKPLREEQARQEAASKAAAEWLARSDQRYEQPVVDLHGKRHAVAEAAKGKIAELRAQARKRSSGLGRGIPIPVPLVTRETVADEFVRYRLKELESYRNGTKDTGAARTCGEKFLEIWLGEVVGAGNGVDGPGLLALAETAIQAGSRDPIVRCHHAIIKVQVQSGTDRTTAVDELIALIDELSKVTDPGPAFFSAKFELWRQLGENRHLRPLAWKGCLPTIVAWLKRDSLDPSSRRSVCERVLKFWTVLRDEERQWLVAALLLEGDEVDPYIVHFLTGSYLVDFAWSYRGNGYASDVPEDRWAPFHRNLQLASDHLQYAWSLQPELPYAPARLITVALQNGENAAQGESPHFWFRRTTEAQFDHRFAYESLSYSLLSRWGGSREWLYDLAADCVDTGRFDLMVPYYAIEVLQSVRKYELDEGETLATDERAVRLLEQLLIGRERFRKAHPDSRLYESDGSYRSDIVLLLEECGLHEELASFLEDAGETMNWTRQRAGNRPARYLMARTLAARGEIAPRILAFDETLRAPLDESADVAQSDSLENELHALQAALAAGSDGDSARRARSATQYFRHAESMLKQRRAFLAGESVALPLDVDLLGFEPYTDGWSPAPDGVGIDFWNREGAARQPCLRPLLSFRPPMMIEAEFELLGPPPFPDGVGIGWSREGMKRIQDRGPDLPAMTVSASEERDPQTQVIRRFDTACITFKDGTQSYSINLSPGVSHRLQVRLWESAVEYRIDDRCLAGTLPAPLHPDGWLCLGAVCPQPVGMNKDLGAFRIRNVRVRRIETMVPPSDAAAVNDRAQYWEERLATDPKDLFALTALLPIRFEQGRDDEVVALAERANSLAPGVNGVLKWRGAVLARRRDYGGAVAAFEWARNESGQDFEVSWRLCEILAAAPDDSLRDGEKALRLADVATGIDAPRDVRAIAARAAAYAELGNFAEAIKCQEDSMSDPGIAPPDGAARLALYREGKPFRLPGQGDLK